MNTFKDALLNAGLIDKDSIIPTVDTVEDIKLPFDARRINILSVMNGDSVYIEECNRVLQR